MSPTEPADAARAQAGQHDAAPVGLFQDSIDAEPSPASHHHEGVAAADVHEIGGEYLALEFVSGGRDAEQV